jgi:hypothetical protein
MPKYKTRENNNHQEKKIAICMGGPKTRKRQGRDKKKGKNKGILSFCPDLGSICLWET